MDPNGLWMNYKCMVRLVFIYFIWKGRPNGGQVFCVTLYLDLIHSSNVLCFFYFYLFFSFVFSVTILVPLQTALVQEMLSVTILWPLHTALVPELLSVTILDRWRRHLYQSCFSLCRKTEWNFFSLCESNEVLETKCWTKLFLRKLI